jgi:hypothetical protein
VDARRCGETEALENWSVESELAAGNAVNPVAAR